MAQPAFAFVNGEVLTASNTAMALVISGPWLVYVGDDAGARALASSRTWLLNLEGKSIVPGFVDAHTHMVDHGLFQLHVDLFHVPSRQDALARVARRASQSPPGAWVLGYRWLENNWQDQGQFSRQELDAIGPDQPVLLTRLDGHLGCANSAALARLAYSPNLRGLLRGPDGAPNGILVEDALAAMQKQVQLSPGQPEAAILTGVQEANWLGVTSIHDMAVDAELCRAA